MSLVAALRRDLSPARLASDWRLLNNGQRLLIAAVVPCAWYSASVLIRVVLG